MKRRYSILLILLVAISTVSAGEPITLEFEPDLVQLNTETAIVTYGDSPSMAAGARLVLPTVTRYVELEGDGDLPTVAVDVLAGEKIGTVRIEDAFDTPTSDDVDLAGETQQQVLFDSPVVDANLVTIGGGRFLRLLVLPVSVDSLGGLTFNRQIRIFLDDQPLDPARLLTRDQLPSQDNDLKRSAQTASSSSSSDVTEYLIVTSSDLLPACERLADYKNATGINSEVALIEEILAAYTGRDDAERLRNYLKDFYAEGGVYLLLAGDETQLPIRYAYPYTAYSIPDLAQQQVCDLYFADLNGEWDYDNDGVWGEKYVDQADLTPELYVGRLPFGTAAEMERYIDKLIRYETNPGGSGAGFLENVFFFTTDQMRDYGDIGQHGLVAQSFPGNFVIDTIHGIEQSSGADPNPTNMNAKQVEEILDGGYGIVNILSHGSYSTFGVWTSGWNEWPKSYFTTDESLVDHGLVSRLAPNHNSSFYYSVGCDNGAFDMDQPPFNQTNPNLVQTLLSLEAAGAVGFVANSRWGWVGASHYLHKAFYDSLFANPELPAVAAMYASKEAYYYYRDLVYGQNFYGDPTLKIYDRSPLPLAVLVSENKSGAQIVVSSESVPVADCEVVVSLDGVILGIFQTGVDGLVESDVQFDLGTEYTIAALKNGYVVSQTTYTASLTTDISGSYPTLPDKFMLKQNYPNPFNPTTTISFELPRRSRVTLEVFNILGQMVRELRDETFDAGGYAVEWNGADDRGDQAASGIYLYRLSAGKQALTKKMVFMK